LVISIANSHNKSARKHVLLAAKHSDAAAAAAKKGDKKSAAIHAKLAVTHTKLATKENVQAKAAVKKVVAVATKVNVAPIPVTVVAAQPAVKAKVVANINVKDYSSRFNKALSKNKKHRVPHVVTAALADDIDTNGVLTEEDVAAAHKKLQAIADVKGSISDTDVIEVALWFQALVDSRNAANNKILLKI